MWWEHAVCLLLKFLFSVLFFWLVGSSLIHVSSEHMVLQMNSGWMSFYICPIPMTDKTGSVVQHENILRIFFISLALSLSFGLFANFGALYTCSCNLFAVNYVFWPLYANVFRCLQPPHFINELEEKNILQKLLLEWNMTKCSAICQKSIYVQTRICVTDSFICMYSQL